MTFIYVYAWWHIPAAFTVLMLLWGFLLPTEHEGVFVLADLLFSVSAIAIVWAIAGFLK